MSPGGWWGRGRPGGRIEGQAPEAGVDSKTKAELESTRTEPTEQGTTKAKLREQGTTKVERQS